MSAKEITSEIWQKRRKGKRSTEVGREGGSITHSSRVATKGRAGRAPVCDWGQSGEMSRGICHREQKYSRKIKVNVCLFPTVPKTTDFGSKKMGSRKKRKENNQTPTKNATAKKGHIPNQTTSFPPPSLSPFSKTSNFRMKEKKNRFSYVKAGTEEAALTMVKIRDSTAQKAKDRSTSRVKTVTKRKKCDYWQKPHCYCLSHEGHPLVGPKPPTGDR